MSSKITWKLFPRSHLLPLIKIPPVTPTLPAALFRPPFFSYGYRPSQALLSIYYVYENCREARESGHREGSSHGKKERERVWAGARRGFKDLFLKRFLNDMFWGSFWGERSDSKKMGQDFKTFPVLLLRSSKTFCENFWSRDTTTKLEI